jgi:membrane-associated protease RseP (regulator of RpoE activity)
MNVELVSMLAFFAIVGILLWKDRKNVEVHGVLLIRKWKGGLRFMSTTARRYHKALNVLGYIAIVLGILIGVAGLVGLFYADVTLEKIFGLVLPTAGGYKYPGPIFGVPFWYWLVAIFIILFVHETSHGVFSRLSKIPVKNYGIILLLLLPFGAFVEPDMNRIKKLGLRKKLQIFAAGSFANFITALICIALAILLSYVALIPAVNSHVTEPYGVVFNGTLEGYPMHDTNITGVATITSINGIQIKTAESMSSILNNTKPGSEITISIISGKNVALQSKRCITFTNICVNSPANTGTVSNETNYTITTAPRPDKMPGSFLGVTSVSTYLGPRTWVAAVFSLLQWLFVLNVGIGIANLLPWKPFDGGVMTEEILASRYKKTGKKIAMGLTILILLLILFNLFGIVVK